MKVMVIGTGTMGLGITMLLLQNNYKVILKSRSVESLDRSKKYINDKFNKLLEKNKILNEDFRRFIDNIEYTLSIEKARDADLIIEAVCEDINLKRKIFSDLDNVCKNNTIFATNTSSLSITDISKDISNKERFLGMHFFNPVHAMDLVEVVKSDFTQNDVVNIVIDMLEKVNKKPIVVKESPGFVVNRILIPMINEAIGVLDDNISTKEEIDMAMKLGANHPIGPLELADLIGNDICLEIMKTLYEKFDDEKYKPHPMLIQMVKDGFLGKKTGKGFYEY